MTVPESRLERPVRMRASVVGSTLEVASSRSEELRLTSQRSGERHPLALSTGEHDAALADGRRPTVRKVIDELVNLRDRGRAGDGVVVEPRSEVDVVEHRPGEQERLLEHEGDGAAQLVVGQASTARRRRG